MLPLSPRFLNTNRSLQELFISIKTVDRKQAAPIS